MTNIDVVRAWKDENYRNSLSSAQRAMLPPSPTGLGELSGADLLSIVGGSLRANTGFTIQPQAQARQTLTVGSEQCCSTGDLPCGGGSYPIGEIVVTKELD